MKKILVAVDGSAESQKAANEAMELAKKFGCSVTFLTVVELKSDVSYTEYDVMISPDYFELREKMIKGKMDHDSKMLHSLVLKLGQDDIKKEELVVLGDAHPKIVEVAQSGQFDLIVMGHRGLNPLKRFFLGSVAKRVIEDSPCSVLITK